MNYLKGLNWKLLIIWALLAASTFVLSSCTCDGKETNDGDDTNDDTTDNDTDDTDDEDDTNDDDTEDWYIYTVDPDKYSRDTSIDVDLNNKVHISYLDYFGGDFGLMYATNKAKSWQIFMVDPGGYVGVYSSIEIDSNGKVHIGYYDMSTLTIKYATNKSGSWQTSVVANVATEEPGTAAGYNSLALDSNDKVHIAYHYCGDVYVGECEENDLRYITNKSGSWQIFTIDTQGATGIYPSIAVDQDGKIHISYFSYYSPEVSLQYATNRSGSWEMFEIASVLPYDGVGSSISLDSNGKIHISYQSSDNLIYATNVSGTWKTTTLDSGGGFIAVDSNDKVHISYSSEGKLKYATNKTGEWKIITLDSTGIFSSIAIDSDNYVHISYRGGEEDALKYATNRPPGK